MLPLKTTSKLTLLSAVMLLAPFPDRGDGLASADAAAVGASKPRPFLSSPLTTTKSGSALRNEPAPPPA